MMLHSAAWRRAALHATSRTTLSSAAPAAAASLFTSRVPPAATCAAQQRRHMGCGGGGGVDAYKALGLSKTCSQDEIKKAYRKLAKQWHPDLNQDKKAEAEKKFKEISEAYQMISDADKRKQYDMFGGAAGGGCGGMGGGFPGGMGGNVDPEELFKQMFGGDKGASIFKDLENLVKSGKMQGGGMPGGMGGMGGMPGGMPGGMGGAGGPGAFYSVNLADILGKAAAAGGGAGGFPGGFPGGAGGGGGGGGGFPGGMNMSQFAGMGGMGGFGGAGGSGGSGEQTIQQIVMRPDGKRAMRTTKITFKNGKPHSEVTEKLLQ